MIRLCMAAGPIILSESSCPDSTDQKSVRQIIGLPCGLLVSLIDFLAVWPKGAGKSAFGEPRRAGTGISSPTIVDLPGDRIGRNRP